MFPSYNKGTHTATRLGNWQEELALEELTGYTRAPASHDKVARKAPNASARRVMDTRGLSTEWQSTSHTDHVSPSAFTEMKQPATMGPRALKRAALIRQQVADESASQAAHEDLLARTGTYVREGSRLQDWGAEAYAGARGNEFARKKAQFDGPVYVCPSQLPALELPDEYAGTDYSNGTACTVYSYVPRKGQPPKEPEKAPEPAVVQAKGFRRSSIFSADIHDPTKAHAQGRDMIDEQSQAYAHEADVIAGSSPRV